MHIHDHISEKDEESLPLKFSYLNGILLLGNWLECFMDCFIKIHCLRQLHPLQFYFSNNRPHLEYACQACYPNLKIDMLGSIQKFDTRVCCEQWSAIILYIG